VAAPLGFWPIMNNGVTPALFCFIWLYVSAAGPGPWSLDALRQSQATRSSMTARPSAG
jgi:putative oxidoreductase